MSDKVPCSLTGDVFAFFYVLKYGSNSDEPITMGGLYTISKNDTPYERRYDGIYYGGVREDIFIYNLII